jgi:hypothetical protein
MQLGTRVGVSRRHLVAAALAALALAYALSHALGAGHRSLAPVVRHRPARPQPGLSSLPPAAQGPISAALGADDPAYHVNASSGGFEAANPAQRLTERFGSSGVVVRSGKTRVGLSLRAIGYGSSLAALPAASPDAKANRVTYVYPGLTEWYRNGPLGLEQGFTITRPPAGRANAALTVSLALAGATHVSLGSGGQSLTLSHAGGSSLHYGGLRVSDARGRTLHSWLELHAGGVLLRVNARDAHYPLRIDPFIQQGEKLVGTGQFGPLIPRFGYRVALSSDGNTALIGGPQDFGETGAAWVFTREAGVWKQQGSKLAGTGETGEGKFGASVALSSDGNTALIGGSEDNKKSGAAWVFTREAGVWKQQGSKLTGSGGLGSPQFGFSVALSSNGNTALIGGPGDTRTVEPEGEVTEKSKIVKGLTSMTGIEVGSEVSGAKIVPETHVIKVETVKKEVELSNAVEGTGSATSKEKLNFLTGLGAAWVFTRASEKWTEQAKLVATSGEQGSGELGTGVALSGDGNTALLGGPGDNLGAGAAWVFTFVSSKWEQQAKLADEKKEEITSEAIPGELGASVALASASSGAANTALFGAPGDNKGLGAAWVYTGSGSTWTQQGPKLTGAGEVSEEPGEKKFPGRFGASVALSSSESPTAASTALIGGPGDNKGVGAAWAFLRSGSTWTLQGSKLTGSGEVSSEAHPGEFGAGVALSSDGNTALMGGPGDNSEFGAVWAFTREGGVWKAQGSKLTGSGASARSQGGQGSSAALSSDGNTALIGGAEDDGGAAWVFTREAGVWKQQGSKLTGAEEIGEHPRFGDSVALSSDGNTALIGGPQDARIVEIEGEVTEKKAEVKGLSSTAGIFENTLVSGTKIETGTFVKKVINEHEVELSKPVEGTGTATVKEKLTFTSGGVGSAWVFTRAEGKWTQQGSKLTGAGASGAVAPRFGSTVALSSDGNTALIGGPGDRLSLGSAWWFTRAEGKWTQQEKLTGSGETGFFPEFGVGLALSGDGNTALIGAPFANFRFEVEGEVTEQSKIVKELASVTGIELGMEVKGTKIVPGTHVVKVTPPKEIELSSAVEGTGTATVKEKLTFSSAGVGAAWAFTRAEGKFTQQGSQFSGGEAKGPPQFGTSLALSANGNTALIGGPGDNSEVGAAWVFTRSGSTYTQQGPKLVGTGESGKAVFGSSVALSSEGNTALIGGPVDNNKAGATWVFARSGSTWTQQGEKLTPGSGAVGTIINYGTSAALSSEGNTALIGGPLDANRTGAAWVLFQSFPTVVTGAASGVLGSTATLNAKVNPDGSEVSECKFEYGTTEAYGSTQPCSALPGSGTSAVAVSASVAGLSPVTTYHFRIFAKNAAGSSTGQDQTFKTLPLATVVTGKAEAVTQTSATLKATVNPNGVQVSQCKLEFGLTTSYGSSAPCTPPPEGGTTEVPVSAALESLAENTTYHFRISATDANGTSVGLDETFKTTLVLGPHWYVNNVRLAEGPLENGPPVIAWGKLALEKAGGTFTCQWLAGGDLANPAGGGAAKGVFEALTSYDCEELVCEGAAGKPELIPEGEWSSVLIEEPFEVRRDRIESIALRAVCVGGTTNVQYHGMLKPEVVPGSSIGAAPAKLQFGAGSGELQSLEGTAKFAGALKFMGFEGGEILRAKKT